MSAAAPAAMEEGWEATRQKKRRKKHMEEVEVSASSSQSPRPPATPDSKTESPAPNTAETLTSTAVAAGKGRKRKKQEVAAASSLVGEAVREEERRKGNRSKPEAAAATPSPSIPAAATAAAQILEVAAEGTAARKEQRRGKLEQWQSGQQPSPVDVHPQGEEAVVDGGVSGSKSAGRSSSGKPRVLTNKEILRERILWLKEHPVPVPAMPNPNSIDAFFDQFRYIPEHQRGHNAPSLPKTPDPPARPPARDHLSFLPSQLTANQKAAETMTLSRKRPPSVSASGSQEAVKAQEKKTPDEKMDTMKTEMANPNSIDQDPKYSSPFGPFVDQLCYIPEHRRGCNAPSLPKTPDPPARPPPRDHLSFRPSHLTENQKAAKTMTLNTKRPPSVSASGSQKAVKVQEKKRPDEKMDTTKWARKKTPVLSAAEKRSDKYRRLPLNQLVPPPCSPYNLLQERYAHDPWKVIVICMLCNATRGNEVRKKLDGFFKRYPDAQTACTADPEEMAAYLAPMGLQHSKRNRIQKMSKAYVEEECTYITELFGVDKYAADAYAIFCAGRATEVVPDDHKLVFYWKYVCFELPAQAQEKKRPDEKMDTTKRARKKTPLLSAAEKRSDKYRRLPLNQLVPPPCSPYNLLQERYAHDPWKVIVICMLCNGTTENKVRKKLDGFFERYPDAQTACTADPEKMAEYLAPLGLQHSKTNRIQIMSKAYVEQEWTYITELFGVEKYAADAYAIFCAGRATEVVPDDHMLVFYWKYVCFELPTQASWNAEEAAGVTGQKNFAPAVQRISVSC